MLHIVEKEITSEDAINLLAALNASLKAITNNSGAASFDPDEMQDDRAAFLIAYEDGKPMGCGAIRKIDTYVAEIKRVFAYPNQSGVGRAILEALEQKAVSYGYHKLILETRKINEKAVRFYLKNGYEIIDNYGKYKGVEEAICFSKHII